MLSANLLNRTYYIVNGITLYRMIAAFLLILLIVNHQPEIFKWLPAISFLTDAVDGCLARRYKVVSVLGAKLDSIADDLIEEIILVLILPHWKTDVKGLYWVIHRRHSGRYKELLAAKLGAGFFRGCQEDLHSRNVFLLPAPRPFLLDRI